MNRKTKMALMAAGVAVVAGGGAGLTYYLLKKRGKTPGCDASSCPVGQVCVNGACVKVECSADSGCKSGKICESHVCVDPLCSATKKCAKITDKCSGGRCVPGRCPTDYECLSGTVCDPATGTCVDHRDCTVQGFTCDAGQVCDRVTRECVDGECDLNVVCTDPKLKCDTVSKKCVPKKCPSEYTCPSGTLCDAPSGSCVVSECDDGTPCSNPDMKCNVNLHKCVPKACPTDFLCDAGTICDTSTGKCTGSSCGDAQHRCPATFMCDSATLKCVKGTQKCPLDFACDPGYTCDSKSGTCVKTGCFADADCPTNFTCNLATHACVAIPEKVCPKDFSCDPGMLCGQDGKCMVDQAGRIPSDTSPINPASPTANVIMALNKGYTWATTPVQSYRIIGSPRTGLQIAIIGMKIDLYGWSATPGGVDLTYPSHVMHVNYSKPLELLISMDTENVLYSLSPV
jgi:hypothetical protein